MSYDSVKAAAHFAVAVGFFVVCFYYCCCLCCMDRDGSGKQLVRIK